MSPILRLALTWLSNDLGTTITPRLLVRGFAAAVVLLLCLGAAYLVTWAVYGGVTG